MRHPSRILISMWAAKSRDLTLAICLWGTFAQFAQPGPVLASVVPGPDPRELKGSVVDDKEKPVEGAVCTLTGGSLTDQGLTVTSDTKGEFVFNGLSASTYAMTCAAIGFDPVAQKGLEITESGAPAVTIVLSPETVHREKVDVTAESGKISGQSSSPPSLIGTGQLRVLPLTEQKFKAALPLVPGVVRTPDGKINIKGSLENQGMLLVDSAETVDPVSGSFSIDVPIDAIETLEVYKSTYRSEYGRFSGGLTSILTKAPSSEWHFELNDFLPTPRVRGGHIVGIADDRPRLNLTGPLVKNKLNFSEAFTYEVSNQPVRGLAWPHNETRKQGFTTFTNFQVIFSASHLLTASVNAFPLRIQYANINSFLPQSASSDYGQQGFFASLTDRYLFHGGGVLTTLVKYTVFDSNAHSQGNLNMIITPNAFGGNYFNDWRRNSKQQEVLETYQFAPRQWLGRHEFKAGGSFVHRAYSGEITSRAILLRRLNGSLAERIGFGRPIPVPLRAEDTEAGGFFQDHWALTESLVADFGLRYSGQTVGEKLMFAPRLGFAYSPKGNAKTILRGGVGVFYDRVPLLAGNFDQHQTRFISLFDLNSRQVGPTLGLQYRYEGFDRKGKPFPLNRGSHLDSTPHNITWSLEADRELRPNLLLRLSYLSSRTLDMFNIDSMPFPAPTAPAREVIVLSNKGNARYHEFETTMRFRAKEGVDLNASYVRSTARGDLNTLSDLFVPFEQPVVRRNFFGKLPSNVPDRVVAWGRFQVPWEITVSPLLDVHTGFPYSSVDVRQDYVGAPNSLRFPNFASLDLQLTKAFRLPFLPLLKNHKLRGAFQIYNVTNHSNPRDVFNNVASPFFRQYAGFQHRFYDVSVDIIY